MLMKEEVSNKIADEFLWYLVPFGSMDIMHLIKKAYYLNISASELSDILYQEAEDRGISLFDNDGTTDINALLNDYILSMARDNISDVLDIDLYDYNVFFFANYLDDPLQYPSELVEDINQAIKEHDVTRENFDMYALYVLDKMEIGFKDSEETMEDK